MENNAKLAAIAALLTQNALTVEVEADCLAITNDEGLDAFLHVGSAQITVSTILFPVSKVADQAALNDLILRTHQLVPLSTVGISRFGEEEYYVAFGALSVDSKPEVILEEVLTLLANTPDLLDAYLSFLN